MRRPNDQLVLAQFLSPCPGTQPAVWRFRVLPPYTRARRSLLRFASCQRRAASCGFPCESVRADWSCESATRVPWETPPTNNTRSVQSRSKTRLPPCGSRSAHVLRKLSARARISISTFVAYIWPASAKMSRLRSCLAWRLGPDMDTPAV